MSARDRIHAMLPPLDSPAEAEARAAELDARLDAVRVEDLNEGITRLGEWTVSNELKPGLDFAVGVLKSVRDREPAAEGEPTFFQPGHTYTRPHHGETITFVVEAVSTSPDGQHTVAHGWRITPYTNGGWEPSDSNDFTGWTDVTGEVTS